MTDTNETIADIIGEIRAEADYIEETARGSLKAGENYDGIAFTESDLESALDLAETKRKEAGRLDAAHKREVDALKQRCAELDAEVAAKDEVIKRLNDAISEEQRRKMATAEKSSAVGDCAKLREALCEILSYIESFHKYITPGKGKK
jgi:chromosome segregation ATPase